MIRMPSATLRRGIAALLAVSSALAIATTAHGGTYNVTSNLCGWTPSADGWSGGLAGGCNQSNLVIEQTGHPNPGTFQWWRMEKIPSTVNINSVTYDSNWDLGHDNGRPFELRLCSANPYGSGQTPCSGSAIDYWALHNSSYTGQTLACGNLITHTCAGILFARFFDSSNARDLGGAALSNVRMTIADLANPAVSSVASSFAISQGGWVRGVVGVGATGTDSNGSGIKEMAFVVPEDPERTVASNLGCYYGAPVPCPTSTSWTESFDTTSLADGSHPAYYRAKDAGDNTAKTANFSFKSDNTRPSTPTGITASTNGSNGWSSDNEFDVSWINGGETLETATQSGVGSVVVDVNPTEIGQSDPAPVFVPVGGSNSGMSATLTSVAGVNLPAAGKYTLRISLVDRAGNTSPVGDGSGSTPDSDLEVGFDPNPPAKPNGYANGWISRDELASGYDQEFSYAPLLSNLAPVCGFAGSIDQDIWGVAGSSINVPGGSAVRKWRLPGTLSEATHYVHLRAVSCNGVATPETNTTEAKVDRTDPVGSISGVEKGKWYQDGKQVTLGGEDMLSGMAPASPNEPRSTAGAYLWYRVNGDGPPDDEAPRGADTTINIHGEGQKELRFSPVDFAGNKANPIIAAFGIDGTDPIGFIDHPSVASPSRLSARLGDVPSGVSYAIIAIRPTAGGEWENLPTSLTGLDGKTTGHGTNSGVATARFPDTERAAGIYDVRLSAYDQAGNQLQTQRHEDGSIATVENPMRAKTGLSVKLFKALRTCSTKTRNGRKVKCAVKKCTRTRKGVCYRVLRGQVVLVGGSKSITSEFKRGAVAAGVLSDEHNRPLANTDVTAITTEKFSGKETTVGRATTDANGLYSLRLPAGVSRTVRIVYDGSETRRPAAATAEVLTRAKLSLKLSRERARTGQTVTFSGKVIAFDSVMPSGGKIVALQFYAARKWRPAVGVAHTDSKGRFRINYTFDGAKVKAKIIFRVVAPSEDGWGHTYSVSKTKVIRLNF